MPKTILPNMRMTNSQATGRTIPKKGDTVKVVDDLFIYGDGFQKHLGTRVLECRVVGDPAGNGTARMEVLGCTGPNTIPKGAMITRPLPHGNRPFPEKGRPPVVLKSGGHLEGVADGEKVQLGSADKGGMSVGAKHGAEGGIKGTVGTEERPIEFEGEEIILTAPVASDSRQYDFNGKKMSAREIASELNVANGGVSFAAGGDVKSCKCSGKKYDLGGETKTDREIIEMFNKDCGCAHTKREKELDRLTLSRLNGAFITVDEALNELDENRKAVTTGVCFTLDEMKKAFEAGNEMIWEDLEQTTRVPRYGSFDEWGRDKK